MRDETQREVARNEGLFRDANEAIERGQWPGDPPRLIRFRCECASLECGSAVDLYLEEYEGIRQDPRRFVVLAGHETEGAEVVVETHERYAVVVKTGVGGPEADARDPRRRVE